MSILLSAHGLQKSFGARSLFENLHFVIETRDRIGLIGANGTGKSTLLKILAGKIDSDQGKFAIPRGMRVGYLAQVPELSLDLTIEDETLKGFPDSSELDAHSLTLEWMAKLNLSSQGLSSKTRLGNLSGGWQKKVALIKELVKEPDILLLDEPTNHLDIESIMWLEDLLIRAPFALVLVTHDRLFLQKVTTRIFELGKQFEQGVLDVRGNYSDYLELRENRLSQQRAEEIVLKNKLRRETEWLRRGPKARTTKQQARIERAGELKEEVKELEFRNRSKDISLEFQTSQKQPKRFIEAKSISKSYGSTRLFENFSVFIGPGSRVGLLGMNGCGKSTLIRCLLGEEEVDDGHLIRAEPLKVAYFEQKRESLDPTQTVKQTLCPGGDSVIYRGKPVHIRGYLDRFLFSKEQSEIAVGKLSGGEQARLLLAKLMLKEAQVLVLDEPTNDLDIQTLDILQGCLVDFEGAVILVSHDRYFLDQVTNEILAFPSQTSPQREIIRFSDLWQWENGRKDLRDSKPIKKESVSEPLEKKTKKLSYHEVRELGMMEEKIHQAESKLCELQREASLTENQSNSQKLTELYQQISDIQNQIENLYLRWAELEKKSNEYGT
ncbi:MAG: ABC-F family ATP-binding cassette domain-containing protein [Deltaproteobacteria bacterium]